MKILLINKILLSIELIPLALLFLLSLFLLGDSRPVFLLLSALAVFSVFSIMNIIVKLINGNGANIDSIFIYMAHIGVFVTLVGALSLLIYGNQFKEHGPNEPYGIFIFGVVALIPYSHAMLLLSLANK